MLSCSLGIRQPKLDPDLRAFLAEAQPWSLILFREACVTREQVRALCVQLREAVGRDAIIYIDQEGGRVARLKPPEWPVWPAAAAYGRIHAKNPEKGLEAARLGHRLIAEELKGLGVDGDFAPVLDVPVEGADKIVGDRAFADDAKIVPVLARAAVADTPPGGRASTSRAAPRRSRSTTGARRRRAGTRGRPGRRAGDRPPSAAPRRC